MAKENVIEKLKNSGLTGRGGANFPTWLKWDMVKKAVGKSKYIVCNFAEGEPGVKKDFYIMKNFPSRVVDGMKIALNFFPAKEGIIYINPDYFDVFEHQLKKEIGNLPIKLFKKPKEAGYIGGEETAALNTIEHLRTEPRLRPPFPPTNGLWDCPTLINNVETFYDISLIFKDEYKKERFYTIDGDCIFCGVYKFPDNMLIGDILKKTKNYPDFEFFVQVGGEASGEVLSSKQLKRAACGAGSITIYSALKHKPMDLIRKWINFFTEQSCGKCTPCREGTYRLREMLNQESMDWEMFFNLISNLSETSFCGLGGAVPIPIKSYFDNILKK